MKKPHRHLPPPEIKPHRRPEAERSDPKSEFFLPNHYSNRRGRDDGSPVEEGPPYRFDAEAIVYQSELNPAFRRDPLEAAEILADLTAVENFDRERWHCARCYRWTAKASLEDKSRVAHLRGGDPVTYATDPDACNGCLLSHLDGSGASLRATRNKLFADWVALRMRLDRAEASGDSKGAEKERKRLRGALEAAREACLRSGYDPARRRRREAQGIGEAPELGVHHDRERRF